MRRILVIGMGAGHPEHITIQAINALRSADVLFITDKGQEKDDLARVRREMCERYAPERRFRTVVIPDPPRDRSPANYQQEVESWHEKRAVLYEALFAEQLSSHESGAFLVWGDPSLYDSTLRILEQITARARIQFEYDVIPGITSIQALTATHRIPLNRIGEPVQITTGRKLAADGNSLPVDSVVMLDGETAFTAVAGDDVEIFWGAYVGTPDEIILSGKLSEVSELIQDTRAKARERKGWIMDIYLLRTRVVLRR